MLKCQLAYSVVLSLSKCDILTHVQLMLLCNTRYTEEGATSVDAVYKNYSHGRSFQQRMTHLHLCRTCRANKIMGANSLISSFKNLVAACLQF
jgi:hypothetical protein